MNKLLVVLAIFIMSISSFAAYNVGDVCIDLSWTTEDGEATSIYEQVDNGKAVMIFFGQTWWGYCTEAAPLLIADWENIYGPEATGDFADKSYWVCTENWNNQNYPISLSLYYDIGPFLAGGYPTFAVIGPEYKVYYNGNSKAGATNAIQSLIIPSLVTPISVNLIDDFESGSISTEWYQFGDTDWTTLEPGNESTYCIHSGDLDDSESATLVVGVDYGTNTYATVSFDYKVSSELNYDFLHFMVDGFAVGSWSGNSTNWNSVTFEIPVGAHTLTWIYEKDTNTTTGEDKAWIDNISVTGAVSIEDPSNILDNYNLAQNYPNPFNPITKINYEFTNDNFTNASIVVFNNTGQEVWNKSISAESSSVEFDASKMNSGVYYYSLVVDGMKKDTKAMILVK